MQNKDKYLTTKERLLGLPVPQKTTTYTPIPHRVFLEEIQEEVLKRGYSIAEERFLSSFDGQVMSGFLRVNSTDDLEINPSITILNSYNKMRRAEIRASALVLVCKNGMIGNVANGAYSRKHNGNALDEFRDHIEQVIDGLEEEFNRLITNKNEMKRIELNTQRKAYLVGDMILNEQLLTPYQFSYFKDQEEKSEHFKGNTLWDFYNHITEVYKDNQPLNYDKQHIKLHTYISDKFMLTGSRGLYEALNF